MPNTFRPDEGASSTVLVNSTGTSVTIPVNATSLRLYNKGPNDVMIKYGKGAQEATLNDVCLPAGALEVFGKEGANTLALKCAANETATVNIVPGNGQ